MKKPILSPSGRQTLKSVHLIVSVIWLGAAISMNVLRWAWVPVADTDLYAVDQSIAFIDSWVVVPAAWLSLLTGIFESWLTPWGFFKYRWVIVKWIGTLAMMIYAPLFLSQWDRNIVALSKAQGLLALQNPVYLHDRFMYSLSGVIFIVTLFLLSLISSLKPWTRTDRWNMNQKQGPSA